MALSLFSNSYGSPEIRSRDNLETYRDQISKSQVLLLQQNRTQALSVLHSALIKEDKKSMAYLELSKNIKKTAEYFLSEKSQQFYELAVAQFSKDKKQALNSFRQAYSLDGTNTLIIKGTIFTHLSLGDCRSAQELLNQLKELVALDGDIIPFSVLQLICLKEKDPLKRQGFKDLASWPLREFWMINNLRWAELEGVKLSWSSLVPSENSDPEFYYFLWAEAQSILHRKKMALNYRNLCHTAVPFDKAYGWFDPLVCVHRDEVDKE